jgi:hypothetical protein
LFPCISFLFFKLLTVGKASTAFVLINTQQGSKV